MKYEALEWDSDFFGFPVARLVDEGVESFEEALRSADANGIRCLYFLCSASDPSRLQQAIDAGFRPYDVRVELSVDLEQTLPGAVNVRGAEPGDALALEAMAAERMRDTRFWADPRFPRDRVRDLYIAWVRRGMSTAPLRRTLVIGDREGFITCRFERERGTGVIELIAVATGKEGLGYGDALVRSGAKAFLESGLTRAGVVTQASNVSAQRLYQRNGFRTARTDFWLHRWVEPGL